MGKVGLTSVLLGILAVNIGLGVASRPVLPSTPDITTDFLPNAALKPTWCDYQHSVANLSYCETVVRGQVVTLVVRDGKVIQSTWPVQDKVVADFILVWRTPTGINYLTDMGIVQIYWGHTAIWTIAKHFSPDSRVYFITYGCSIDEDIQPWSGFVLAKP